MIRRSSRREGFTLIELMCAATILVVALVGLLATYFVLLDANEMARNREQALSDAKAVLEAMRNVAQTGGLSNVTAQNWALWVSQNITGDQNHMVVGDAGSEAITVTYTNPAADPLEVNVRVDWTVKNGRPQSLALRTLMTQR